MTGQEKSGKKAFNIFIFYLVGARVGELVES
jgi:hypothetical protein